MRFAFATVAAVVALSAVRPSPAAAQSSQPIVRPVGDVGAAWVSGIVDTRNGRFVVYAAGDSIFIRDRETGATNAVFAPVVDLVVNALGSSAAGDRIVFTSRDDQARGPYVWMLTLDTLTGRPIGRPHRVGVAPAMDPSISPDGRRIAFVERNPALNGLRGASRLVTMPSTGGDATVLLDASGKAGIRAPRWSADGSSIFFQLYPYQLTPVNGPTLWRVPSAGGRADSLTRVNLMTDVSPNGEYLALFPQGTNWQRTMRPRLAVTTLAGRTVTDFLLPLNSRPYSWSRTGAPRILAVRTDQRSALRILSLGSRRDDSRDGSAPADAAVLA